MNNNDATIGVYTDYGIATILNNFSEDMIFEAAKLSAGKSSPIAYMNAILSNWKNKILLNYILKKMIYLN